MSEHIVKRHNKTLLLYHLVVPAKYRKDVFTPAPERPHLQMGDGRRSGRNSAPRNLEGREAADFSPRGSTCGGLDILIDAFCRADDDMIHQLAADILELSEQKGSR